MRASAIIDLSVKGKISKADIPVRTYNTTFPKWAEKNVPRGSLNHGDSFTTFGISKRELRPFLFLAIRELWPIQYACQDKDAPLGDQAES
jgi:hypothetical protein